MARQNTIGLRRVNNGGLDRGRAAGSSARAQAVGQRLNSNGCRGAAHGSNSRKVPHWPTDIVLVCLRRAVMRLRGFRPGRRAARRCHALWRPAYNRTACPRSGSCKSSVRQKPSVMRAVSIHNVVCPEADIMRHHAEVHARGAAGPMTNVSNFVGAGFRHWRKLNPLEE